MFASYLFLLLCATKFRHLEPVLSSGMQSAGESYKAERWLLHSLQVHMLSAQLRPLLRHLGHTKKYYNGKLSIFMCQSPLIIHPLFPPSVWFCVLSVRLCFPDDAFLLSEPHVTAMFQCLEAVEQNNPKLLAQIDTVGVSLAWTHRSRCETIRFCFHLGHFQTVNVKRGQASSACNHKTCSESSFLLSCPLSRVRRVSAFWRARACVCCPGLAGPGGAPTPLPSGNL